TAVPAVLDISNEPEEVRRFYGLDSKNAATAEYARRCLLARRLVERGVRFVQIFMTGQPWDTHNKNAEQLTQLTARTDQPCAALLHALGLDHERLTYPHAGGEDSLTDAGVTKARLIPELLG